MCVYLISKKFWETSGFNSTFFSVLSGFVFKSEASKHYITRKVQIYLSKHKFVFLPMLLTDVSL